jgi:CPA1 family monovalent cation:H+ antiporter
MSTQAIIAVLLCFTAFCSYINYRYLRLSPSIGITLIALVFSTVIIELTQLNIIHLQFIYNIANSMDFNTTFMGGMISFLLFAGALHLNTLELAKEKTMIFVLATFGVLVSTFLVGILTWTVSRIIGIEFNLLDCFIFGALISPTDPIAVMGVLKKISAPKALEINIAGESLFNDGTGIVVFVILLSLITGENKPEGFNIAWLFVQQLFGGLFYGVILGFGTSFLLRKINDFHVSALITLAMVSGGYLLALQINVSGPIAIVMAGLIVGTKLRSGLMSEGVIRQLDSFWALMDEALNAILFVLIGLEFLKLPLHIDALISALAAIPIVLFSRFVSVALPITLFKPFRSFTPNTIKIMTWGGLRGGVSIALALSLQSSPVRNEIITVTYAVVVFSLLIQGLTIGPFIRKQLKEEKYEN